MQTNTIKSFNCKQYLHIPKPSQFICTFLPNWLPMDNACLPDCFPIHIHVIFFYFFLFFSSLTHYNKSGEEQCQNNKSKFWIILSSLMNLGSSLCADSSGCFLQFNCTCERWWSDSSMIHNYIHTMQMTFDANWFLALETNCEKTNQRCILHINISISSVDYNPYEFRTATVLSCEHL